MTHRLIHLSVLATTAVGLLVNAAQAVEQMAEPIAEPQFDVIRYDVVGNGLLDAATVEAALSSHIGPGRRFADVEAARQGLLAAYASRGYATVQVTLPEQEIAAGVVRLEAREVRLGKVTLLGAKHHDLENVRASLPDLREGEVPNTRKLADSLHLANANPAKQTYLLFKAGKQQDETDTVIRLDDEKPWKAFASLDNSGNKETGETRLAIGYQHANLFNRDHVLTLQYITSPAQIGDVSIIGAGYHLPLYRLGDAIDLNAGYSNVNSGTVQDLFNVSGQGAIFGARYTHNFSKKNAFDHKLSIGIDYRAYTNNIDYSGQPIGADVTVHPLSLAYNGQWRGRASQAGFYLTAAHNIPGGDKGQDVDFAATRTGAAANYGLARFGGSFAHNTPTDWQIRAAIDAQYSDQPLVPGEQFGLGGHDSVRGFGERAIAGDRGWRASMEAYTPDLGDMTGLAGAKLRFNAFVEGGHVERHQPQSGEDADVGIASTGVGLRFGYEKNLSVRMDYGYVLDGGAGKKPGDGRLHASVAYVF